MNIVDERLNFKILSEEFKVTQLSLLEKKQLDLVEM
jgi:hypothetical protein